MAGVEWRPSTKGEVAREHTRKLGRQKNWSAGGSGSEESLRACSCSPEVPPADKLVAASRRRQAFLLRTRPQAEQPAGAYWLRMLNRAWPRLPHSSSLIESEFTGSSNRAQSG